MTKKPSEDATPSAIRVLQLVLDRTLSGVRDQRLLFGIVLMVIVVLAATLGRGLERGSYIALLATCALLALVLFGLALWEARQQLQARDSKRKISDLASVKDAAMFRRALGAARGEEILIVIATADVDPNVAGTHIYDVLAALEFVQVLYDTGYGYTVVPSGEVSNAQLEQHHIVSIGGPIANRISKNILTDERLVFRFDKHDIYSDDGRAFRPTGKSIQGTTQYGLITRMPSPYSQGLDALVLAACWGSGTRATTRVLTRKASLRSLDELSKPFGQPFQIVTQIDHDNDGRAKVALLLTDTMTRIESVTA